LRPLVSLETAQGTSIEEIGMDSMLNAFRQNNFIIYAQSSNLPEFQAFGANLGLKYKFNAHFTMYAHYAYFNYFINQQAEIPDMNYPINTPDHKFSAGILAENLFNLKNWSINVDYRWVNAYQYSFSTFLFGRRIPAYNVVDLKIQYRVPGWKTTFAIGGTNILNYYHIEAIQGASIGATYFIQINFDSSL